MEITDPVFQDAEKARHFMESQRWPDGPVCPHCGNSDPDKITSLDGKAHRSGLYQCGLGVCRKQFTVTVGSVFERSKVPLNKWLLATYLLCAGKKGTSSHQIHRTLGVSYKTAWFMMHRLREAMRDDDNQTPMGGSGKVIQADETYYGYTSKRAKSYKRNSMKHKMRVVALLEPGGEVRSFHVASADKDTVRTILVRNASRKSHLVTDEAPLYTAVGREFADHTTVQHVENKWVSPEGFSTNNIENFFGTFKRGMRGIYQHCDEKHLQRYLHEFDFRYTHRKLSDTERTAKALSQIGGKRLTYREPEEAAHA